ncbi:MAG: protein-L-isoaspartate(D-aspartate) O-methyltransferase [Candidatus Berkelbacteria bacterium Licking1014_85]|uniref:Protein-L-isoaspartate O-methyltransferase n=1 Tax=Candidatus Berkelbacteria bacterium Licking1014_85 TaxID=2017148 RepID=A0A554LMU0_9BACT|nr:MAG: protein-L-isoaspartate(D-aspartate) O-methyltransferase [Candidatus Berkelbacteria bacterium Licking1014_85]
MINIALDKFILYLTNIGVLKTPKIIDAFRKVDRKDFVREIDRQNCYQDIPLSIGFGQTISQPYTVAFMLELLQPKKGDIILDIGSGSGWTSALLAEIVGKSGQVYGVERISQLIQISRKNIQKYQFGNLKIYQARHEIGLKPQGPFDKILVSASADEIPSELIYQLKPRGRIVIPVKNSIWKIEKKTKGKIFKFEFPGFVFVPLISESKSLD